MTDNPYTIVSEQELDQVITDLEQYRARIVTETLGMARRIRVSKLVAMEQLQGNRELQRVDMVLKHLRSQTVVEMSNTQSG